jgi:hypothetical protein
MIPCSIMIPYASMPQGEFDTSAGPFSKTGTLMVVWSLSSSPTLTAYFRSFWKAIVGAIRLKRMMIVCLLIERDIESERSGFEFKMP